MGPTETKPLCVKQLIGFIAILFFGFVSKAQEKVDILATDEVIYNKKLYGENTLLQGNVKLGYSGSILTANEAILLEGNAGFKAKYNVKINQGDTLFLRSEKADYSSSSKVAIMQDSVELEDKDLLLKGPKLTYNRPLAEAFYEMRSRIYVKENGAFIESNFGYYFKSELRLNFNDSVIYTSEDFILEGEDLDYYTNTENLIYNKGANTTRLSDSSKFYSEKAIYKQKIHEAYFSGAVKANKNNLFFNADSLFYNDSTDIAIAYNRVTMVDTTNEWILRTPYAENFRKNDSVSIPYRNELILLNAGDSIHLFSDSLSIYGSEGNKKILALGHIKIAGKSFQGVCDTLIYAQSDSSISMISAPVLWQDSNQIEGLNIKLFLGDDGVKRMYIPSASFITEKVGDQLYNQIKGRELEAFFEGGEMRNIIIQGNGEAIYHAFDDKADSLGNVVRKYIGVNVSQCSNMEVVMKLGKSGISSIKFLTKPVNQLKPASTLGNQTFYLDKFNWLKELKPILSKEQGAFNWQYKKDNTSEEIPIEKLDIKN